MSENTSTCTDVVEPLAYSTADAARLIGVKPKTLSNWRYEGTGPAYVRISHGLVLYRREDIDAWLHDMQRRGGVS